ncbi:MAG TPA: response regulator [Polyangiaceae bacterium]|nr:response regulator [Polyangiaceae bacterium]
MGVTENDGPAAGDSDGTARAGVEFVEAAAQAKLGVWAYDERTACFVGPDIVRQIFDLPAGTEPTLDVLSRLYVSESPGALARAVTLALKEGKPFQLVSEVETPSGLRKSVQTQGHVTTASGAAARKLVGTFQDISEIRLIDRVTQESEMTLGQVERIAHIGRWSVSLTDGSFYHSDEVKRIFGYEPSEYALSVEDAISAYHPEDRDEVTRLFNRAVETGEGYEFDLRIAQPSGETRHVHSKAYTEKDALGKVIRVFGIFQDVTQRVLAERALRESDRWMKVLVDAIHTAIVVHGKEGEILLSNRMANRLLAPLASDVLGKSLADPAWRFVFEDGRDVPMEELPVSRILRTREPIENLVVGRRDGDSCGWLLVNGVPLLGADGEIARVIISFVDITERREMEERLTQSEKMRAIGQLAGGVAHDFNNQLTVMMSFADLLRESLAEDAEASSWLDSILASASRSAELTKQLLAFARKGNYVVAPVDFNQLTAEVASIAGRTFDKKIRILHRPSAETAMIRGDATQLQSAVLNVVLNARDAMPGGGDLLLATDRVALGETALLGMGLDAGAGEYLRVTIRDTGVGMDASTQRRVFEPFFTTKAPGKGTGMGMASVYGTVKNQRGAIEVESELGKGTTITMFFPLVAGSASRSDSTPPKPQVKKGRILVIDDEPDVARSISLLLQRQGYQTTTCGSGSEGVSEFERSWQSTDLVLLDMIMPDMDGVETFHALRAIDPDVKVVLVSGYSFTEEAKQIREEGAAAFLSKPITSKELLQSVSAVLSRDR